MKKKETVKKSDESKSKKKKLSGFLFIVGPEDDYYEVPISKLEKYAVKDKDLNKKLKTVGEKSRDAYQEMIYGATTFRAYHYDPEAPVSREDIRKIFCQPRLNVFQKRKIKTTAPAGFWQRESPEVPEALGFWQRVERPAGEPRLGFWQRVSGEPPEALGFWQRVERPAGEPRLGFWQRESPEVPEALGFWQRVAPTDPRKRGFWQRYY